MPEGPGKYDDEATLVRLTTEAQGVVLLVMGGRRGSGFSVQTTSREMATALPRLLRMIADDVERGTRDEYRAKCTSPAGETGHGAYVHTIDGVTCCLFCDKPMEGR